MAQQQMVDTFNKILNVVGLNQEFVGGGGGLLTGLFDIYRSILTFMGYFAPPNLSQFRVGEKQ